MEATGRNLFKIKEWLRSYSYFLAVIACKENRTTSEIFGLLRLPGAESSPEGEGGKGRLSEKSMCRRPRAAEVQGKGADWTSIGSRLHLLPRSKLKAACLAAGN